jgi:hypothetical protein
LAATENDKGAILIIGKTAEFLNIVPIFALKIVGRL